MNIGARADRKALEEIVDELGLQIADARRRRAQIHDRVRTPAEIHGGDGQRLVHRHHEVAGAVDPRAGAERLRHRLAERDPEVLHGVVLIDVEVAARVDAQIERAVPRDELQHVIEEPDAAAHAVPSLAVERETERDLRLAGAPIDHRAAHSTSSITAIAREVCSTMPVAIRRQPLQPGSVDRSRR